MQKTAESNVCYFAMDCRYYFNCQAMVLFPALLAVLCFDNTRYASGQA